MITRPVVWTSLTLYLIFIACAWILPNRILIETLRAMLLSISIAVVIAYAAPAVSAMLDKRRPDLVAQLTLGIALGWAATAFQSTWSLIYRLAGQPLWMQNNDLNALIIWSLCLAAALHITAPGAIDGRIPRRNMVSLGLAIGAGVLIVSIIMIWNPNVDGLVDAIKPWLYDPKAIEDIGPRTIQL